MLVGGGTTMPQLSHRGDSPSRHGAHGARRGAIHAPRRPSRATAAGRAPGSRANAGRAPDGLVRRRGPAPGSCPDLAVRYAALYWRCSFLYILTARSCFLRAWTDFLNARFIRIRRLRIALSV